MPTARWSYLSFGHVANADRYMEFPACRPIREADFGGFAYEVIVVLIEIFS
ncbi:MAG: hypothetical protein ACOYWZ_06590 [Bacillota bacterium]